MPSPARLLMTDPGRAVRKRGRRLCAWTAALGVAIGLAPSAALGYASLPITVELPAVLNVGDRDVPAKVILRNGNFDDRDVSLTVCNAGDGGQCAGSEGITLTPSCGTGAFPTFPCGTPDVGVFRVNGPARAVSTECPGMSFTVTPLNDEAGRLALTPTAGHVVLPVPGAVCAFEFTIDVLRFPHADVFSDDATPGPFPFPGVPGTQTQMTANATAVSNTGSKTPPFPGVSSPTVMAVPRLAAVASRGVVGDPSTTDAIALADEVNPASGNVTFRLFGRNDVECTGAEVFSAVVPIHADGTATTPPYTPPAPGGYRWLASYGGDTHNNPAAGTCGAANESVVTNPPPPAAPRPGPSPPAARPSAQPCTDCDHDGFPAPVDCNDKDARVHPGARDTPHNRRDEDCSGHDAPYERLDSRVRWRVEFLGRSTIFRSLRVERVRAGSTIRLTCDGRDCPLKTHKQKVKRYAVNVDLTRLLGGTPLRPGTRLQIRITKPRTIGIARRLGTRDKLEPKETERCLAPTSGKPVTCRR